MHSLYPQLPNAQVNNLIVPIVIGQIEFIMEISISLTPDVMHTCALLSYNACKPVSEINRSEFLIPKYYSKQIYYIATIYNNPSISQLYLFTLHSNSFVLWLYLYIQLTHSKMATVFNIWLFFIFQIFYHLRPVYLLLFVGLICLPDSIGAQIVHVFLHLIHSWFIKMKISLIQKICWSASDFYLVRQTFLKKLPRQSKFIESDVKIHVQFMLRYCQADKLGCPGADKLYHLNTCKFHAPIMLSKHIDANKSQRV